METLFLVIDSEDSDLPQLQAVLANPSHLAGKVLSIQGDEGVWCHAVTVEDTDEDELLADWPASLTPAPTASFISLDYRSTELAVAIVRQLSSIYRVVVDTNFGRVVQGAELTADMLQPPG